MVDKKVRFICGGCSLLCNDVEFNIENNKITDTFNCCGRADINYKNTDTPNRIKTPFIKKNGSLEPANLDDALKKSAEILLNAKNPIIYGFTNSGCEEMFEGVILAKKLNAYIDTQQSVCLGIFNKKRKEYKLKMMKLEKVKDYVDLIVFWGSNVSDLHLRLASKYVVFPRSGIIQSGKESRTVICIDIRPTPTEKISDISYYVEPQKDKELLKALIKLHDGERLTDEKIAGLPLKSVKDFYELLNGSKHKIIFIGPGFTAGGDEFESLDLIAQLAKKMGIILMPTTSDANTFGCDFIMRSMTRYPFAVSFKDNKTSFNDNEFSLAKLLKENSIDAALIVNADPMSRLPFRLVKKMAKIPMVVIDHHKTLTSDLAQVILPMSMPGVECSRTFIRLDGVITIIDKVLEPPKGVLTGSEIINKINKLIDK
ncbi:MAG: formylmethanofuran dehydrogenase subunit B [Candidatus Helarchaeota archaeon]